MRVLQQKRVSRQESPPPPPKSLRCACAEKSSPGLMQKRPPLNPAAGIDVCSVHQSSIEHLLQTAISMLTVRHLRSR